MILKLYYNVHDYNVHDLNLNPCEKCENVNHVRNPLETNMS